MKFPKTRTSILKTFTTAIADLRRLADVERKKSREALERAEFLKGQALEQEAVSYNHLNEATACDEISNRLEGIISNDIKV